MNKEDKVKDFIVLPSQSAEMLRQTRDSRLSQQEYNPPQMINNRRPVIKQKKKYDYVKRFTGAANMPIVTN